MPKTAAKRVDTNNKTAPNVSAGQRKLTVPKRRWHKPGTWRYHEITAYAPLPKARVLFVQSLRQLWVHKALFGGIALLYGVLYLVFVRSLAGTGSLSSFKHSLDSSIHNNLANTTSSFVYLFTNSSGDQTTASGVYQTVLLLVCSLAVIWALRQTYAKHKIRIRDSFYRGMYPLVPFFLVFLLLTVQLVPLAICASVYGLLVSNKILAAGWETFSALFVLLALLMWTLRLITASVIALYVVTLPDMAPLQAYRSAKGLVMGRRLLLWRKFLFLPLVLLIVVAGIEIPLIALWPTGADWMFMILGALALPIVHSYYYALYRELL